MGMICQRLLMIVFTAVIFNPMIAHAEHRDIAPLSDDIVQKMHAVGKRSGGPLADRLNQHLESLRAIADDTQTSPEARRMLLAGKRAELKTLSKEADAELSEMRDHYIQAGMHDQLPQYDDFVAQVKQRFSHLDQTLASIDSPSNRQQSLHARKTDTPAPPAELGRLQSEIESLYGERVDRDRMMSPGTTPTFRTNPKFVPKLFPASHGLPKYLSQTRSVLQLNQYAYLGNDLLAAVAPSVPADAQSCGYTSDDLSATSDAPQSAEITALAAQLSYSPVKIYQYVHDNIKFEPYYGSMKGAVETLHSRAGGSTDQASLLIALLRASNIPARYVRGRVQMLDDPASPIAATGGRVGQWTGAKSYAAATQIMLSGGLGALVYPSSGTTQGVEFNQVWVEACVPYSDYRGAGSDTSGERWVPLDPSYKDSTYQAGIANSLVPDYGTYLSKLQNGPDSLPYEAYAKQLEASIRTGNANLTVQDVPYSGKINPLSLDTLPNSLPYDVINFTNWTSSSSPEIAKLPDDHRYAWYIGGLGFSGTGINAYVSLYLPDVAAKRVTLSFAGATTTDQTNLTNWLNSTTAATPCNSINVTPVIMLDGVPQTLPAATAVDLCKANNALNMYVGVRELSSIMTPTGDPLGIGQLNNASYTNIGAANWHALEAYALQGSNILINQHASKLVAQVNSTTNPDASAATMDATEGEYLHIIGLKYLRYLTDGDAQIAALYGGSGHDGNHLGLVSSQMKVSYLFDLPFAVSSGGFLVDVAGAVSRDVDLVSGQVNNTSFLLGGFTGSAYESYVLQENAHTDAVSTVRGLQFAYQNNIPVLTGVNSSNWQANANGTCIAGGNCDKLTNGCNVAAAIGVKYSPNQITNFKINYIDLGWTLNYIPVCNLQYSSTWQGAVFQGTVTNAKGTGEIFAIGKNNGGWTVDLPEPTNTYIPTINSYFAPAPEVPSVIYNPPPPAPNYITYTPAPPVNSTTATSGYSYYTVTAGDPVNMVNGNMYHQEHDFAIKGRGGLSFTFDRFYNSNHPADGPLGFGWTHNYNHLLKLYGIENSAVKLSWVDGTGREVYFSTKNYNTTTGNINTGVIASPSGIYVTLQRLASGVYTITDKDGTLYSFNSVASPNQTVSASTTPAYAQLQSITDRNGNTLTMHYTAAAGCQGGNVLNSVTDALNRALSFTYTGCHLNQISDFMGRAFKYAYTDSNNNLNSFSNPLAIQGLQKPVTYTYYSTSDGVSFNHLMKQYTLPRGNGMLFEYYANGRTFRHTVVLTDGSLSPDQINSFTYNDFRRETVQTNELGNERHFFFDPFGNMIQLVEENGATRRYTYDCADVSQAPGSATCKNPFNRLSKTDPDGNTTSYSYDTLGNVLQVTNPSQSTVQYADYNSFNQPRRIKDANGNWTINRYDTKGNKTDEMHMTTAYTPASCATAECALPGSIAQIRSWLSMGYDSVGNPVSSKQVRDFTAQLGNNSPGSDTGPLMLYGYDSNQLNMTSLSRRGLMNNATTAAVVNTATLTYDTLGRLKTGVNQDWYATVKNYDAIDRVISATDDLGNLRSYRYDDNNNPVYQSLEAPVNGTTTLLDSTFIEYDASDRKIASYDSAGNATRYTYDAASNVLQTTNPDNYSIGFDYDADNRPVHAYDQENHAVFSTRDVSGRVRTVTDPNGNVTTNTYWDKTQDGRLKAVTLPTLSAQQLQNNSTTKVSYTAGRQTQYSYDANGNKTVITEMAAVGSGMANRITTVGYDELNRPIRIVSPQYSDAKYGAVCPVTLNTYDNLGNLSKVAAGYSPSPCTSGDVTIPQMTYGFDDFAHRVSSTDGNGKISTYVYDSNNNLSAMTDANAQTNTYQWGYGHQLQSRIEQGGRTTTYTRNALGQVTDTSHPNASFHYDYDTAHRLMKSTETRTGQTGSKTLAYTWSPGGLLNNMTDNDGGITSYQYDPVGRLSGMTTPAGFTVSVRFDAGGRMHEKTTNEGINTLYQYNEDNTLAALYNNTEYNTSSGITPAFLSSHVYSYDGFGQRNSVSQNVAGNKLTYNYTYDALNRLIQTTDGTAADTEIDGYDPWNNRTTQQIGGGLATFTYDHANQMTQVNGATFTYDNNGNLKTGLGLTYTWDALNQLVQVNKGSTVTNYSYDDQGRRTSKTYNNGSATTTQQFTYNGDAIYGEYGAAWSLPTALYSGLGTDQPVVRSPVTAANTYGLSQFYAQDGINSVVAQATQTSSGLPPTAIQTFDPWGFPLTVGGTISQYGYTGREKEETGLIYYRARYRDPNFDRFVSRDPMGLSAGLNQYSYADANPVNITDPTGMTPQDPVSYATGSSYNMAANDSSSYFSNVVSGVSQGLGNFSKGFTGNTSVMDKPSVATDLGSAARFVFDASPLGAAKDYVQQTAAGNPLGALFALGTLLVPEARVEGAVGGTYLLRDEADNVVRSGRSNDLVRRESEHARDPILRDYDFEAVHRTDVYSEQRGLEQMLHETYNPPLDKINPISPKNKNLDMYLNAAKDYLKSNE